MCVVQEGVGITDPRSMGFSPVLLVTYLSRQNSCCFLTFSDVCLRIFGTSNQQRFWCNNSGLSPGPLIWAPFLNLNSCVSPSTSTTLGTLIGLMMGLVTMEYVVIEVLNEGMWFISGWYDFFVWKMEGLWFQSWGNTSWHNQNLMGSCYTDVYLCDKYDLETKVRIRELYYESFTPYNAASATYTTTICGWISGAYYSIIAPPSYHTSTGMDASTATIALGLELLMDMDTILAGEGSYHPLDLLDIRLPWTVSIGCPESVDMSLFVSC